MQLRLHLLAPLLVLMLCALGLPVVLVTLRLMMRTPPLPPLLLMVHKFWLSLLLTCLPPLTPLLLMPRQLLPCGDGGPTARCPRPTYGLCLIPSARSASVGVRLALAVGALLKAEASSRAPLVSVLRLQAQEQALVPIQLRGTLWQ